MPSSTPVSSTARAELIADAGSNGALGKRPARGPWRDAARYLVRSPLAMLCLAYLLALIVLALFPGRFAPLSYEQTSFSDKMAPPGSAATSAKMAGHVYVLGADRLGRDMLSRLIYGTRVSLTVALIGGAVSFVIGITYGLIAGSARPRIDNILMRFVDVVYAYPTLILIILFQVYFTSIARLDATQSTGLQRAIVGLNNRMGGLFFVFIAIGMVSWLNMARLTRGQVLYYRNQEFIEACHAIGVPQRRILGRHLLPNVIGPCIVAVTLDIPIFIYTEAFLSFIGLGVNPPTPSWGGMVSDGYGTLRSAPHILIFPALALFLTMLAFNFLGDTLRDALDPRTRGR